MCHRKQEQNRNILRLKTSKKIRTLSLIKILLVLIKKSVSIKIHHIYLPVPKNKWNMLKVNNKDTRRTSLTSFWCLYCQLWIYFLSFSSVSVVDFEQELKVEVTLAAFLTSTFSSIMDLVKLVKVVKVFVQSRFYFYMLFIFLVFLTI